MINNVWEKIILLLYATQTIYVIDYVILGRKVKSVTWHESEDLIFT